ncbi:MAG: MG2 domain-containing protein [Kiritimatiellia bacterium]|jgi:hypothetical protein|nr:MG2 domain-containing protein [Kiritimatiellia bacterium]
MTSKEPRFDELDNLLCALAADALDESQREALEELLNTSADARQRYLDYMSVDAMLQWRFTPEQQVSLPKPAPKILQWPIRVGLAAAAALLIGMLAVHSLWRPNPAVPPEPGPAIAVHIPSDYVTPLDIPGWRVLVHKDAVRGQCDRTSLELTEGDAYVQSIPTDGQRLPFSVNTPAGVATARGTRFHVIAKTGKDKTEVNLTNTTAKAVHMTRVLVMSGIVALSNSWGMAEANSGERLESTSDTAPKKLMQEGHYKEALDIYKKLVVDPAHTGAEAGDDLGAALQCMNQLGRPDGWDELAEKAINAHPKDWRLLWSSARGYYHSVHYGRISDGKFYRGHHIRSGRQINARLRDRIRALQLMQQALPFIGKDDDPKKVSAFYMDLASQLRGYHNAWILQALTDIENLPDLDDPNAWGRTRHAPVHEDNRPVFYPLPKSWKTARNDGERWRWLLHKAAEADPERKNTFELEFADFLRNQFGVQTLGSLRRTDADGAPVSGLYAAHTLDDNETLARLATGVQRLKLPKDFSFITRYRKIAGDRPPEKPSPIKDLTYSYYEGDWDELPDFDKLKPKATGKIPKGRFDATVGKRKDYFGLVFEGTLQVPKSGTYTFTLDSDDGSILQVGDAFELNYDGLHGMGQPKSATAELEKGSVAIRAGMFEKTGDEGLGVTWSGPGFTGERLSRFTHVTPEEKALNTLAGIYENRLQLSRAAKVWEESIERYGAGNGGFKQDRLDQILKAWCRLEGTGMHPAGEKVELSFSFRNARRVNFVAHKVKLDTFIEDIKAYIKSDPKDLDWQRTNLDAIGNRLVKENEAKYLAEKAAEWAELLKPADDHWEKRIDIETPLKASGLYLLKATAADGNTSRLLVWITDSVIVDKRIHDNHLYFVSDATTGEPLPQANLEFFGWKNEWHRGQRRRHTKVVNFAEITDAQGVAVPNAAVAPQDYSYLVIARTEADSRFAVLGFTGMRRAPYRHIAPNRARAYIVTDRPVYRPKQKVHIHSWVRHARYDLEDISRYAGRSFVLRINDPTGKKLLDKSFKADTFGDFQHRLDLAEDARLGRYGISVIAKDFPDPVTGKKRKEYHLGSFNFNVEEYKKPEYEVTVEAPKEPTKLGDTIEATVKARYYFGAPVTKARVKYTVRRTEHYNNWMPPRRWDWFYGEGYWWFWQPYDWYPRWPVWGCIGPRHWHRAGPPEIVQENTVEIGAEGEVKIKIDTAVAKALHGDVDHKYEVTAEVVDESRRTIVGKGSVIAARQPFKVFAWSEEGHYRVGDEITAKFQGRTPDGKPVEGKGKAVLYAVAYDNQGNPEEEEVQTWDVGTDENGTAKLSIKAHAAGQYRLSYKLTSTKGHEREGAMMLVVRGKGFTGADFRFNDLELIPDKAEYKVGDRMQLMVNTARKNSTVLLFPRAVSGVTPKPIVLRLDGKSVTREFEITARDLPNFHIEAVTVSGGRIFTQTRNIAVPPEKRVLDVAIAPSETRYKPGAAGKVKIRLTDIHGKPFEGQAVVSVYDKSVEYISNNRPQDIKVFFWKWQRQHGPYRVDSLSRRFAQLLKKDEKFMRNVGAYGAQQALWKNATERPESAMMRDSAASGYHLASKRGGILTAYYSGADKKASKGKSLLMESASSMNIAPQAASAKFNDSANALSAAAPPPLMAATVRKDFADTACWSADITTDQNGEAEIDLTMPENLTTWKIQVWALGHGTVVGEGSTEVVTSKDLLIRLQAPRFFVERDKVLLSANVHNYLDGKRDVRVALEMDGGNLVAADKKSMVQTISLAAKKDKRVDWWVNVEKEGRATIRMKAQTTDDADAMQMEFPVYVHGSLRTESWSGVLKTGEKIAKLLMQVPKERRPDQSHLEIRYSPSIALAMVDALPYLARYHHKNCESIIHRFMPAVLTKKLLADMDIDLNTLREKTTNLNPQEIGDSKKRAKQWKKFDTNPIFDNAKVTSLVKKGLADLGALQNQDGGFSWLPHVRHRRDSDAHTTALVVHGLKVAKDNGLALVPNMLERGVAWLEKYEKGEVKKIKNAPEQIKPYKHQAGNLDAFVYLTLAENGKMNKEMRDFLYRDRLKLARYCQAQIGLAYHMQKQVEKRDVIVRNLRQFQVVDKENQSAYLDLPNKSYWWYWYGNEIETMAMYLRLLVAIEPNSDVTSGFVKYLLNNRKHATYWHSTRDTALCLEAIARYIRATDEDKPDMTVSVSIDDDERKEVRITPDTIYTFDNVVELKGQDVTTGKHTVTFEREGTGRLYFNAYLTTFSLEDHIKKAGLEIKVERRYYKLVPEEFSIKSTGSRGQVVGRRVDKVKRVLLKNGDVVRSGDKVEVELIIQSKNDYEHLVFEDRKPAGFEAVRLTSGHTGSWGLGAYTEFRDERVSFQVRRLSRGTHALSYKLRAEIPGTFSALPATGNGMYAPELRANSDEIRLTVKD